ncbi:unnamed protein product [Bursaphelenchus okinawaensis]|uniref:Sm domain-containing protein n=1 Tax=Bursaphelenchus okinawaensis TaxID=465554 RepID=A0A811LC37_9BILA|nr:unnamed protein product [Bursaphelenchus okinawaensis]CAG9120438.1 unnamed protein product [Bursaphelenchus okinawaensis]
MDPFGNDFDASKCLHQYNVPETSKLFGSFDEWEEHFIKENKEFVSLLLEYDKQLEKSLRPMGIGVNSRVRKLKDYGKQLLLKEWEDKLLKKNIFHIHGTGFGLDTTSITRSLLKWASTRTVISVKLSPSGRGQKVDRLIKGVLVSYDKKWNLLLKNVDEIYRSMKRPPPGPPEYAYKEVAPCIFHRSLVSYLVMGKNIVCIYT